MDLRFRLRMSQDDQLLVQRAAHKESVTFNEFIVQAAVKAARAILAR